MRVIKFRGKDKSTNEWVYGTAMVWNGLAQIIRHKFMLNNIWQLEKIRVHHETVGQFTGLIDKKGVDIYEHDKLDNDEVVAWSIEQGCFFAGHSPLCMSASHREVIGNIHELTT
jgi:hypothetical protein